MRASRFIENHFPAGNPNFVVMVSSADGVDGSAATAAGRQVRDLVQNQSDVAGIQSYWTAEDPAVRTAFRSKDGKSGLMLVSIRGSETESLRVANVLSERIAAIHFEHARASVGGIAAYQCERSTPVCQGPDNC